MSDGFFVVLEGGDYTGKKVQSVRLANHILDLSEDNDIVLTHEPTRRAREIKRKLVEDEDAYSDPRKMAELYVEDRRLHTETIIEPNLHQGVTVIANRYAMSTCVYQSLQGMPLSELVDMHQEIEFSLPDLTILLNISPQTADLRATSRTETAESKFEANVEFRNNVYRKYMELASPGEYQNNFGNVTVVDGNGTIEEVAESIRTIFDSVHHHVYDSI
jgi:dTMP kinase|tara:strand:- start:2546 stop:3199 length:654 start_codon:yes stop_codon:yes gene_type:complete